MGDDSDYDVVVPDNSEYEAVKQKIAKCTEDHIRIGANYITEVPPLPEHITSVCLSGWNSMILKFPEIYSSKLKHIKIWGTGIKELPEDLPDTVESISLYQTGLYTLPRKLPKNLKYLGLISSVVEVIPELPETLEHLKCLKSHILHLPKLPDNLKHLDLIDTYNITELPETLPAHLSWLNIRDSGIRSLPKHLPDSLETLIINYTPIKDLPENIPDKLKCLCTDTECIPDLDCDSNQKGQLKHFLTHRQCMADIRMEYTGYHSRKRTIARCKAIKCDLIAVTWHTDRVLDWCDPKAFDYDD